MNRIAVHQSQYVPWPPYFKKVASADIFVILDNVQFQKNGVQNRNMIRNKQKAFWLTIPVKGHLTDRIAYKEVSDNGWSEKHWKSLVTTYANAPFWDLYKDALERLYSRQYFTLGEINNQFFDFLIEQLGIDTKIVRMSELGVDGAKSDLILNICKTLGATTYLSGIGGRAYLDECSFLDAGIAIEYLESVSPVYKQFNGDFIPGLSMLDMMLNESPDALSEYMSNK